VKVAVRRLDERANRESFDCGVEVLNDWLRHQAGQAERKRMASVWIATPVDSPASVLGYYSLAPWQISFEACPVALRRKLPRYPLAATLLARLAVARAAQGQGLGGELLVDALFRSLGASETVPVQAVVVHAKDERAAHWYAGYGFTAFPERPLHFYLPIATIEDLRRSRGPAPSGR
jgi:GNAT superfamily N-acetyltransferase